MEKSVPKIYFPGVHKQALSISEFSLSIRELVVIKYWTVLKSHIQNTWRPKRLSVMASDRGDGLLITPDKFCLVRPCHVIQTQLLMQFFL